MSDKVVWNSPEDTANTRDLVWLRENGVVFLGYRFEQPFREYRDHDGFYIGQQDDDSYWARYDSGEPCEPDGWCQLLPPPPAPQAKPEQAARLPSIDEIAQFIRYKNGANKCGAGTLAEHLHEWLTKKGGQR